MQQIADWLEKLGMSEYAQRFAENRIDFSVLRELTDQDLKDLGVVLGDRRKMLRAIADIDGIEKNAPAAPSRATAAQRRTPIASKPIPTAVPPPALAAAEAGGERRYVTVMFDQHFRAARCRRVARPRQGLSRCRLRRRDQDGRPCRQEVGGRGHGAVRLSGGAGERRRTRGTSGALDPTGARRGEPQEY
jgi:hypothetical protein